MKKTSKTSSIKRFGVLSVGRAFGIMYGLMGLILGAILSVLSLIVSVLSGQSLILNPLVGVWSIVLLPLFYGIVGFLMGLLTAWLYNISARWVGGIVVELK